MLPNSARVSGTSAMPWSTRSSSVRRAIGLPRQSISPRTGSTPISAFNSVDLPAPLGPITVTTLPLAAFRFSPCSTVARP